MPEAEAFCCQCSALAACHRYARLALPYPQYLLVWRRVSETQAFLDGCEPDEEPCSSLHLVAESKLLRKPGYIVYEEDKSGRVEGGNEREGSAVRACRGYDPNLGWCALQDRSPGALANQSEIGGDQNAQLLLRPMTYLASPAQQCPPHSGSGSRRAPRHRHSPYPSNAELEASAAHPGAHATPQRCLHQPSWRWWG